MATEYKTEHKTEYTHRVLIVVPEDLMSKANQLALATGESKHDDQTFSTADYVDEDGGKYSVASTVVKGAFMDMANEPLIAPLHAPDLDVESVQDTLDNDVRWNKGAYKTLISIFVDSGVPDNLGAIGINRIQPSEEGEVRA